MASYCWILAQVHRLRYLLEMISGKFHEWPQLWIGKLSVIIMGFQLICAVSLAGDSGFRHPGLLHSSEDIARMRRLVNQAQEPVISGFRKLEMSSHARSGYRMHGPVDRWSRKPDLYTSRAESDAQAAYENALMWVITGNQSHADKSMEILNAWVGRLKDVGGVDGVLASGLQGIKFANAAELLRYSDSGWSEESARACERWMMDVWHPPIKDYAHFANGNWEGAALQTKMAIAIFCNDRKLFEESVRYAINGAGNGSIPYTVVFPTGQCQESIRRQGYAQLGLGLLSNAAEMAWNQGVDLYGFLDNRILKGFEYTAKFGLGHDVPYQHYLDRTGKYGFGGRHNHYDKLSESDRGRFRPIFEQPWNHYVRRRGLNAPYIEQIVSKGRPEGVSRDHPGHATLTHWREQNASGKVKGVPGIPSGIVARTVESGIHLMWAGSVDPVGVTDAVFYRIFRSDSPESPFRNIAVSISPEFIDSRVSNGRIYHYRIVAGNSAGSSGHSFDVAAGFGLPENWTALNIGDVSIPGSAEFDGTSWTLEAEGKNIGGKDDELLLAGMKVHGDCQIEARIIQPMSSQWSKPGVMMRAPGIGSGSDAQSVATLLIPPYWAGSLVARKTAGESAIELPRAAISEPWVENRNRLMKPWYVRLTRVGKRFSGAMSPDGSIWISLGSVEIEMPEELVAGLTACSQLNQVTTRITYDNVRIRQ